MYMNHIQTGLGICSFTLSLKITLYKVRPWAIRSCSSLQKSDTGELLSSLYAKERLWAKHSHRSLQKSEASKLLSSLFKNEWFARDLLFQTSQSLKKICIFTMLLTVFHFFSPFYAQVLFTPIALCSVAPLLCSKQQWERLALVAL